MEEETGHMKEKTNANKYIRLENGYIRKDRIHQPFKIIKI